MTYQCACARTYSGTLCLMETDAGVAAWEALLRVHAAVLPKLERAVARSHLPLRWYDVLLELSRAPRHRLTMSELGERVVLSRERVSRVVDELVGAGHVERQAHPTDGRSSYSVLTPSGRRALRSSAPTYLAAIEEHFGRHLGPRDAAALSRALGRVFKAES